MGKTRFDFAGQVVAVTGAGKGIGKGAAQAFGEAGARVYVLDHTEATGEATAKTIREAGRLDKVLALNLTSVFLCARAAIPAFKRQQSGRIVNVGSMAGLSTLQQSSPPYAAAKAGVHALTRVLAFELGKHGVTVNTLAPGTTASERVVARRTPEQRAAIGKTTLVGRIAEVSDMVGWVLFLAAPESSYLTGQTLAVNGGRLMV
jgi:3-oxoacyl-[acyl-carrier protein] reductase